MSLTGLPVRSAATRTPNQRQPRERPQILDLPPARRTELVGLDPRVLGNDQVDRGCDLPAGGIAPQLVLRQEPIGESLRPAGDARVAPAKRNASAPS